ncbi:MAG: nucleotidyltransferase domain-containing protein [Candidatus Aenigmarchaeota archaeon]|nr:nucleotidyltransferase domain-containing protein [Candidatus Aenigmarchaeota archaeon]
MTTREIEIKSGVSHETAFRLLRDLVEKKYIKEKKIGGTNVYEFVKDKPEYTMTYMIFVYFVNKRRSKFKKDHLLVHNRLYEFLIEVNPEGPAIVFGSYAKGTQAKGSDIDILCVAGNRNVGRIVQTFRTKYNMNIHAVVVKPDDFKNIKKDNPEFWEDLIEYGIVLDGLDNFFKEVYRND